MTDKFVPQLVPCSYYPGGYGCTAASEAMFLYRATQGRVDLTACEVRRETGDRSGGLNLEQVKAVSALHGVTVGALWRPGSFSALKNLLLQNRYPVIAQVGYAPIAGTSNDCFHGSFRGGHALYIKGAGATGIRYGDPGADGRYPGCPNGWQTMSWTLFQKATYALPLGNGMTLGQDYGTGYVYAYIGPADPPPPPSTKWKVHIDAPDAHRVPLLDKPFGVRKSSVTVATYICTLSKVGGYWWYRIETKADGSATSNRGRFFTPNRYVHGEQA